MSPKGKDNKSRHFDIDPCDTREAAVERLVTEYRLNRRKSHQAVYHPDTAVRWIKVEDTRGDFAVRFTGGNRYEPSSTAVPGP